MIRTPQFWQKRLSLAICLLPLSVIWWTASKLRYLSVKPYKSKLPVICIGNLTVGGTGKTPTAILIATLLKKAGWSPVILSRGYGGSVPGPALVDGNVHSARDVGDEPLLLSNHVPVCVSRNRADGARFIENHAQFNVIIMDDGMQNPQLVKDIKLGVFDGKIGIGNGWLLPAGPLRESFSSAKYKIDGILINGADQTGLIKQLPHQTPLFEGELKANIEKDAFSNQPLYAFAGIGRPERFFDSLKQTGAMVVGTRSFADHHPYKAGELSTLEADAKRSNAQLITTEKDWQRLPIDWQAKIATLPVTLNLTKISQKSLINFLTNRLAHVVSS